MMITLIILKIGTTTKVKMQMAEDKEKFFKLGRYSWVLYALLAVLMISSFSQTEKRPWEECKESLIQQMFSDSCTPINGTGVIIELPASAGQNT